MRVRGGRAALAAWICAWAAACGGADPPRPAGAGAATTGEGGAATAQDGATTAPAGRPLQTPGDPALPAQLLLDVRAADGSPLGGVPLEVWWSREQEPARTATRSRADGRQEVPLPHGARVLEVTAGPTALTAPARFQVGELMRGGVEYPLELRIEPAAIVEGVVVDELGRPLGGGRVAAFHLPFGALDRVESPEPATWAQCAEDGSFRLGGFPAGPFVIEAVVEGRACVRRASGSLTAGERQAGFELVTEPARRVVGQTYDAAGAGIAGAKIVGGRAGAYTLAEDGPVAGSRYLPGRPLHAVSDGDGLFTLPAVPESEEWRVDAWHPRRLPATTRLLPGEIDVFLEMAPAAAVEGTLTGADGARLPFAPVILFRQQEVLRGGTDGAGGFLFGALEPEEGDWLLAAAPGHAPRLLGPFAVELGQPRMELQLDAGAPLGGRLLGADGAPLAMAELRLVETPPEPGFPPEWTPLRFLGRDVARTGVDGGFRWEHLPPGAYALELKRADGAALLFDELAAGDTGLELRVPEAPRR